ncbi:MAG: PilZ domain-containing protein [Sphingomonas sp.]|jgi:hypothetical protein|uniref:PilZ domain-containing protein n=1 Tax=Sphingomonas sp. TaxID=28214 RepID=UPI00356806F8
MATIEHHTPADSPVTPPDGLRPRAQRTVTTLIAAKLELAPGKEALCRLRNVSTTGMLVETGHPLTRDDTVVIELRSGERLPATVVWTDEGRVGIKLDHEIDVASTLRPQVVKAKGHVPAIGRAPRFVVTAPGRLSSLGRSCPVMVENLSQSGARLTLSNDIPLGAPVTLTIAGLSPRACSVRWRNELHVGVAFIDLISYAELSAWLAGASHNN